MNPSDPGSRSRRGLDRPVASERPPYLVTAIAALVVLAFSQAIRWLSERSFGGNVPPLFARLSPSVGPWVVIALGLVALAWFALPRLFAARTWVFLIGIVGLGWTLAVALSIEAHGIHALTVPLARNLDYDASVSLARALGLRTFVERYPELGSQLSLHAKTHPPGAVLFLWAARAALRDNLTAVALVVALVGIAGAVPVYALARDVYGRQPARIAAALFVCAPGVLLFSATSMDAVFMTVAAVALAALVRAPRSDLWAFASGVLIALALCFTFGVLSFAAIAIGVGLLAWKGLDGGTGDQRGAVPPLLLVRRAALALAGLLAAALALRLVIGLDLLAVFRATMRAHLADPSRGRPYAYWVFADIPAFLIVAGIPQTALFVTEARSRWRELRPGLETVLMATLVLASLSGVFLGEVDHIWLFFMPLLVAPAGAALARSSGEMPNRIRDPLVWALVQALLMQVLLYTFW